MMTVNNNAPAMLGDLKIANRRTILSAFRRGAVLSVGDVSAQTGISRPTVVKCIRHFLDSGLLISAGKGSSTAIGGKRPENYMLSNQRYFVCLSLWPMQMRAFIYTIGHNLIGRLYLDMPLPQTPQTAGRALAGLAAQLLQAKHVRVEDVCAVSVSTPGTVDRSAGTLMFSSHTPQWGNQVHLLDDLHSLFDRETPIFLENAGKMCARPFTLDPQLRSSRILVLFTTWGVSGTMIERGHIQNGRNSLIGEIGHMTIDPDDTELCGCGSRGCFECLVSQRRVQLRAATLRPDYPDSVLPTDDTLTIPVLFEASCAGDALARVISSELAEIFARLLRNISLVFDPDCVILQGDYAFADDCFRDALSRSLANFHYFPKEVPFRLTDDFRPLDEMDAEGAFIALDHQFFSASALYRDTEG